MKSIFMVIAFLFFSPFSFIWCESRGSVRLYHDSVGSGFQSIALGSQINRLIFHFQSSKTGQLVFLPHALGFTNPYFRLGPMVFNTESRRYFLPMNLGGSLLSLPGIAPRPGFGDFSRDPFGLVFSFPNGTRTSGVGVHGGFLEYRDNHWGYVYGSYQNALVPFLYKILGWGLWEMTESEESRGSWYGGALHIDQFSIGKTTVRGWIHGGKERSGGTWGAGGLGFNKSSGKLFHYTGQVWFQGIVSQVRGMDGKKYDSQTSFHVNQRLSLTGLGDSITTTLEIQKEGGGTIQADIRVEGTKGIVDYSVFGKDILEPVPQFVEMQGSMQNTRIGRVGVSSRITMGVEEERIRILDELWTGTIRAKLWSSIITESRIQVRSYLLQPVEIRGRTGWELEIPLSNGMLKVAGRMYLDDYLPLDIFRGLGLRGFFGGPGKKLLTHTLEWQFTW